jgi:hypothetical protein
MRTWLMSDLSPMVSTVASADRLAEMSPPGVVTARQDEALRALAAAAAAVYGSRALAWLGHDLEEAT